MKGAQMQGKKTHEQQLRILENKPDVPDARHAGELNPRRNPPLSNRDARRSEFAVSAGGLNQESDHNKHNDGGQAGHKPQRHTHAEEKQS
jgi:hypothetical protein